MSTKSDFPIGRLLVGSVLLVSALLLLARHENALLASVAAAWGVLFWISAAFYRTELGALLATAHRDERQSRLETNASQNAFLVVLAAAVAIVALEPAWSSTGTAALIMTAGMAVYLGSLAYGVVRK